MKTLASKIHQGSFYFLATAVFALSTAGSPPTSAQDKGSFRHAVFFKFNEGTEEKEIIEIEQAFIALKGKIDGIIDFEWGRSESVEGLNEGFTHCFFVTFKDKAGLESYLPHPAHEAFVALLKPKLEKVFVFDYTAKTN